MVLVQIGGQGWIIVGSLNGGEVSAKLNREMALLVGSDEMCGYLADVFGYDWDVTPGISAIPKSKAAVIDETTVRSWWLAHFDCWTLRNTCQVARRRTTS
jgi:hypothetical protein